MDYVLIISIISILVSIIAIVVSFLIYFHHKTTQRVNQFNIYFNNLKTIFDKFLSFSNENTITNFKYDFENAIICFDDPANKSEKYNLIQKQIGKEKDELKCAYRDLIADLGAIESPRIKEYIEWFNNMINNLYEKNNNHYAQLFDLYLIYESYKKRRTRKEELDAFLKIFYENLSNVSLLNEILTCYKTYLFSSIEKILLNTKSFKANHKSENKLLFEAAKIEMLGIGLYDFFENRDESKLPEGLKNWMFQLKEQIDEEHFDMFFEITQINEAKK